MSFLVSIRIGKSSSRRRKQIHSAEGTVIDLSLLPRHLEGIQSISPEAVEGSERGHKDTALVIRIVLSYVTI